MGIWFRNNKKKNGYKNQELIFFDEKDDNGKPINKGIHFVIGKPNIYLGDRIELYWGKNYGSDFYYYDVVGIIEYSLERTGEIYTIKEKNNFIKGESFIGKSKTGYLNSSEKIIQPNDTIYFEHEIKGRFKSFEVTFLGINKLYPEDEDSNHIHLQYKNGTDFLISIDEFKNQFHSFIVLRKRRKTKFIGENELRYHHMTRYNIPSDWKKRKEKMSIIDREKKFK